MRRALAALGLLLVAASARAQYTTAPVVAAQAPPVDRDPPRLDVTYPPDTASPGIYVAAAEVRDNSGVGRVMLRYRFSPNEGFLTVTMRERGEHGYIGQVQVPEKTKFFQIYFAAFDALGNGPTTVGSEQAPMRVRCDLAKESEPETATLRFLALALLVAVIFLVSLFIRRDSMQIVRRTPTVRGAAARRPAGAAAGATTRTTEATRNPTRKP